MPTINIKAYARPHLTLSRFDVDAIHQQQRRIGLRVTVLHVMLENERDLKLAEEIESLLADVAVAAQMTEAVLAHGKKAAA